MSFTGEQKCLRVDSKAPVAGVDAGCLDAWEEVEREGDMLLSPQLLQAHLSSTSTNRQSGCENNITNPPLKGTLEAEHHAEMMAFWMAFRSGQNILDMRNWLPELQLEAETNEVATTVQIQDIDLNSETCFGKHNAMRPVDMGVESMRADTNEDLLAFVGSMDGRPTTWDRYVQTDRCTEDVDPKEDNDSVSKTDNHNTNAPQQPATEASRQPTTLLREEAPQEQTLLRHQLNGVSSIVRQMFTKENVVSLEGGQASPLTQHA
ncbi:hypothetical protein BDN71DRAFT_1436354 [Pleurotus eryngii]|uniref:Uncharacterized protein n=1 Tax=Pleurotus eryngii TaxID=5323 RepID=A0A9P6D0X7_PLEER|nr:hypothetical protein BDN71DRAFT_1436354 [Pleurotus eryngii]